MAVMHLVTLVELLLVFILMRLIGVVLMTFWFHQDTLLLMLPKFFLFSLPVVMKRNEIL